MVLHNRMYMILKTMYTKKSIKVRCNNDGNECLGVESSYRRSQPLLERGDEDLISSVVAETVVASSESEGGALPVVEPFFDQSFAGMLKPHQLNNRHWELLITIHTIRKSTTKLLQCLIQTIPKSYWNRAVHVCIWVVQCFSDQANQEF